MSTQVGYGAVSFSLGNLFLFCFTLWMSALMARFISFILDQEVFTRVAMPPGLPFTLSTFTRYAVLILGFLFAVKVLGFSLDRITLLLSALGVGIGFGLQSIVSNFISGVILLFERPVRVGDWVELDDLFGEVTSIGIRASRVRSRDGADILVPNGDFISARVTNWTLVDPRFRLILSIKGAYGTDPEKMLGVLEGVILSHPEVLSDPQPAALFRGFGDGFLEFEVQVWIEGGWPSGIRSEIGVAIYKALKAEGIDLPFPQRDLHLRSVEPELREALAESMESCPGKSD
jgi:small-conductance mechanosensitive channel